MAKKKFEPKTFEGLFTVREGVNPHYTADGIYVDLVLEDGTIVPFHAVDGDIEHGQWIYDQAKAGAFGKVQKYVAPEPTAEDFQKQFDSIWPDVVLGLATEEEVAIAKELRIKIKAMSKND